MKIHISFSCNIPQQLYLLACFYYFFFPICSLFRILSPAKTSFFFFFDTVLFSCKYIMVHKFSLQISSFSNSCSSRKSQYSNDIFLILRWPSSKQMEYLRSEGEPESDFSAVFFVLHHIISSWREASFLKQCFQGNPENQMMKQKSLNPKEYQLQEPKNAQM